MNLQLIQEKAYETIALHLGQAGLRLEDNLRVSDQGFAVTHQAAAVMKATGCPVVVPSNDTLDGLGLSRSPFLHPLSEAYGDNMNLWCSASAMISFALGWVPGDHPSATARQTVKALVTSVAPTVDADALLEASRYSDPSLLKLAGFVQDGLFQGFTKAYDK
jgi:hypothetical protein